jgi:hypothetical protein
MPASDSELAQLKVYARAMTQLIEAMEARYKAEAEPLPDSGAPPPQFARIK